MKTKFTSPNFPQKIFPAHAMNARFAIFLKMPHRTFREDSCIQFQPHAADPESKPVSASPLLRNNPASALSGIIAGRCAGCNRRVFAFCRPVLPAHYTLFPESLTKHSGMLCPEFFTTAGRLYKQNHLLMQEENDESGGLCESLS